MAQMLHTLASLRLSALLQQGGVWLGVPVELSELLNQCCTGQVGTCKAQGTHARRQGNMGTLVPAR